MRALCIESTRQWCVLVGFLMWIPWPFLINSVRNAACVCARQHMSCVSNRSTFKGKQPTPKNTHPNKSSLHQFAQTLSALFSRGKGGNLYQLFRNCLRKLSFYLGGWFFWGGRLLECCPWLASPALCDLATSICQQRELISW